MNNKFKNIKTIDGTKTKLEIIEDLSKYRGFYYIFPDGILTKASYYLRDKDTKWLIYQFLELRN